MSTTKYQPILLLQTQDLWQSRQTPNAYMVVILTAAEHLIVTGTSSLAIEITWEEIFENNITHLFSKSFLYVLRTMDASLKELRVWVKQWRRTLKRWKPYLHLCFNWRNLQFGLVCVCQNEMVAISRLVQEAVQEAPWKLKIIIFLPICVWLSILREFLNEAAKCKSCSNFGKNF